MENQKKNRSVQDWMNEVLNNLAENNHYYYDFDGNNLTQYKGMQSLKRWPAMSGHKDYQEPRFQNVRNKGPLPEGLYHFNKDEFQKYEDLPLHHKIFAPLGMGRWPGGVDSWGRVRVDLHPDSRNQMYGRGNLTIHGGDEFGSRGCIDLENAMDDFYSSNQIEDQNRFPLIVRYRKGTPFIPK